MEFLAIFISAMVLLLILIMLLLILIPVISITLSFNNRPWLRTLAIVSGVAGLVAGCVFIAVGDSINGGMFGVVVIAANAFGLWNALRRKSR